MKKVYYTFNMDIEAIPINYLPNILKDRKTRNNHIFKYDGLTMFSTIVEDLDPHYFRKLSIFNIRSEDKGIVNVISEEDRDILLTLNMIISENK